MRRIKMLVSSAGASGVRLALHSYDVPEDEARALIAGGYAEAVTAALTATPAPDPAPPLVETATEDLGDTETAEAPVAPAARKRGRR